MGGDFGARKSTTGYLFTLRGSAIAWNSKLQRTMALSSCEAECMALKEAIKEQLYLTTIFQQIPILDSYVNNQLYTESQSAIELTKNLVFHNRTKHNDITLPPQLFSEMILVVRPSASFPRQKAHPHPASLYLFAGTLAGRDRERIGEDVLESSQRKAWPGR